MSKNFDGADSAHAAADGSAPQAWVWSQYKGVLPGVENETEALISTDRARHPLAVAIGFAVAIVILVVLASLFSSGLVP